MKQTSSAPLRVGFAASSGGHFEQLMMLRPLMEKYDGFVVTEKTGYGVDVKGVRLYTLLQVNRKEALFPLKMLVNSFRSLSILLKEKPDAVICTGVLAMIPLCLLCKLAGKKLIYLESFAKVDSPTLSGRLLYKHADLFLVQWEQMLKVYPNAVFKGGIY